MATETIGPYQLHLIAQETGATGQWDPFVSIFKFDDATQDFKCILEKYHASETVFDDYDAAIEQARRVGNALLATHRA